jgi:DNA-binding transcriptional ArsR family regulator
MKLVKEVKSTYLEVDRNLRLLERAGIITYRRLGRGFIVRLNCDTAKTQVLLAALEILDAYDFRNQPKGYDAAFYVKKPYSDDDDNELISDKEKQPILLE